jgi:hypothetical protein
LSKMERWMFIVTRPIRAGVIFTRQLINNLTNKPTKLLYLPATKAIQVHGCSYL